MGNRKKRCSIALSILIAMQVILTQPVMAIENVVDNNNEIRVQQVENQNLESVQLGSNVYANFYNEGSKVVITGKGNMYNYSTSSANYSPLRGNDIINTVIIEPGVTSVGSAVFTGCSSLTSITIPESVTYIGDNAFEKCTKLTTVEMPKMINDMGNYIFSGCSSLISVTIPGGILCVNPYMFYGCSSLKSIVIPEGTEYISFNAFQGCTSLTEVIIPKGLNTIYSNAFSGCNSLESITLPQEVVNIRDTAFLGCSNLKEVRIMGNILATQAFRYNNNIQKVVIGPEVSELLETFPDGAVIYGLESCYAEIYAREKGYEFKPIKIETSNSQIAMMSSTTQKLQLSIEPSDIIFVSEVSWKSDDPNIVEVDEYGVCTAKDIGVCTIRATVWGKSFEFNIKVLEDKDCTLALYSNPTVAGKLSGGGVYSTLDEVTIKATAIGGYVFQGWFDGNDIVSTNPTYTFLIEDNMELTAKFKSNEQVNLSTYVGNGSVQYKMFDMVDTWYNDIINCKVSKGTEITVQAVANSNTTFLYWIDSLSGRILSRDNEYTLTIGKDTQIKACYRNQSNRHYVTFIDKNDQVLSTQEVLDGQAAMEPDHGYYNGYEFEGWDSAFTNVTKHMTITAIYQPKSGYHLIVENGIIENQKDDYIFMEKVKVIANDAEPGLYFAGWYEGDILVSTNKEHYIFVTSNTTLTARYSETPMKEEPRVYMKMSERIPIEENKMSLTMQVNWQVPSGFTVIEAGLIRTVSVDAADELFIENVDSSTIIVANKSNLVVSNGTYDYTLKFGEASKSKSLYAKGYLIYKNNSSGEAFTIYTDLMTSLGN